MNNAKRRRMKRQLEKFQRRAAAMPKSLLLSRMLEAQRQTEYIPNRATRRGRVSQPRRYSSASSQHNVRR